MLADGFPQPTAIGTPAGTCAEDYADLHYDGLHNALGARMKKTLRVVVTGFLMIPIALVGARSSTGEQPQTAVSVRSQFLGTWKLVSSEERLKDGTVRPYQELGPHGVGYLMYSADGHMCGVLTNPDRPKWDDPPTAAQKTAAIEGLAAYCGRFELDEASHVMWHYPELAWRPDYVGTKQARPYRFDGDRLIFSGRSLENSHSVDQWTIVWAKVK